MHGMAAQAVLAVVLVLFTATVKSQGDVSFWKLDVTMKCPVNGKWYEKENEIKNEEGQPKEAFEHTFKYEGKNTYHCEYETDPDVPNAKTSYYFYVEGKVCENCYEVDARLLVLVIVVDVVGTALLMLIICMFTKTKSSTGPALSSKAPARSGGRPTPASGSEYESLNRQTVSAGTYSVVNRTG